MEQAAEHYDDDHGEGHHDRDREYFVNGEEQKNNRRHKTVEAILTDAGFTPAADWQLERDSDHHKFTSLTEEVELHDDERFTATFQGVRPTS